jgi:hypothetical protein
MVLVTEISLNPTSAQATSSK